MQTPAAAPLVAEIERLQQELDKANESIDDKLDRLEDAGSGVIKLTNQLEDARTKIISLEEDIGRIARREDRRTNRLERLRCSKCRMKVDLRGITHSHFGDERYEVFILLLRLKSVLTVCSHVVLSSNCPISLFQLSLLLLQRGPRRS